MNAAVIELVVGDTTMCQFGTMTDDHDHREELEVEVLTIQGDAYLVDNKKGGFLGRAIYSESGELRAMTTMMYGDIYRRDRQKAASMLYFQI